MSSEAENLLEKGKELIEDGKSEQGLDFIIRATKMEPNNAEYHGWYAQALNGTNKYNDAIKEANLAIQLDPKNKKGYRQLGHAYSHLKNYPEAIVQYTKAIEIDKSDFTAYECRGDAHYKMDNYKQALEDISRAISIDPKTASCYELRRKVFYALKDYENYLLDTARKFDLTKQPREYDAQNSGFTKETTFFIEKVNQHFSSSLFPKLSETDEIPVSFYPIFLMSWGRQEKQVIINGGSFTEQHGTFGQGYICITNKNLHIISIGELSKIMGKSIKRSSFLSWFLPGGDRTKVSESDQYWAIPNSNIKGLQIFTDTEIEREMLRVLSESTNWEVLPIYDSHLQIISVALNAAKSGKFNNIWQKDSGNQNSHGEQQNEIIELLKQLGELKSSGIISEIEFESKKKELLARL